MSKPSLTSAGASAQAIVPGWYGKLPSLGDFASRRLPEVFIERWDRWLQDGLAQARLDAGEQWRAIYLVSPIRRFWIGPGVIDDNAWCGLTMPSVDRVGRYFPLTLAQPAGSLARALAAVPWYDALDRAARRVLDSSFSVADLESALITVSRVPGNDEDQAVRQRAAALQPRGAERETGSVWWCNDAGDDTASFQCFAGLPPAAAFGSWLGALA
jgi:type VI secretion system protein ImpM